VAVIEALLISAKPFEKIVKSFYLPVQLIADAALKGDGHVSFDIGAVELQRDARHDRPVGRSVVVAVRRGCTHGGRRLGRPIRDPTGVEKQVWHRSVRANSLSAQRLRLDIRSRQRAPFQTKHFNASQHPVAIGGTGVITT
jgi:hypothetical protein